jgi:hypothetical protein
MHYAVLDDHTALVDTQLLAKTAGQKRKGGPDSSTNDESTAAKRTTNGTSSSNTSSGSSAAATGSSSGDAVTVSAVTAGETAIAGIIEFCYLMALLLLA